MLEDRDVFDQEIWWEPKYGHSGVWCNNWMQLGSLHFYFPIDRPKNYQTEEVN